MKKRLKRILALLVMIMLVLPLGQGMNSVTVQAAKLPYLSKTSKTLTGIGTSYNLTVKNKPGSVTYTWSSSRESVATVNGLGQVTAVGKGTATITCKITYSDNTCSKLTCKITVKVPATAVEISNAQLINNAHQMVVGEVYDFNRTMTPKKSSDKTYWVVADEDIITVDKNGVVTALKEGITQLEARTAADKTKAMDPLNDVTDSINIIVSPEVAKVTEVKKTSDKVVTITFSHAMTKNDLITNAGKLTKNVIVDGLTINKVAAADLGTITPTLSSDGKTLTLTTKNNWDGTYNITIESDVTTQSGIAFEGYNKLEDYTDNVIPAITDMTIDETGSFYLISFNKAVDISELTLNLPSSSTSTLSTVTQYVVTSKLNYKLINDNKTIEVDLSGIAAADKNKSFAVTVSGIKDTKGNFTTPFNNTVYMYTNTVSKTNAAILYVERTGLYELTAHFNKYIQYGGYISLNGGIYYGTVDATDKTLVHYTFANTLSNIKTTLTGVAYAFYSYNSTANVNGQTFTVNMAEGMNAPTVVTSTYSTSIDGNKVTNVLSLTFDKEVTLANTSGTLYGVFYDSSSNVIPYNIAYTATVDGTVVTIDLAFTNTSLGYYIISIPSFFVYDSYMNYNEATSVIYVVDETTGLELPAPTSVVQSTSNPSIMYVSFANKVDPTSACTITNYTVDTIHPYSASIESNSASGAVVKLTFAAGVFENTTNYPVYIQDVEGFEGSYLPMSKSTTLMTIKENVAPQLVSTILNGASIVLTFSEELQGVPSFSVYQNGAVVSLNSSTSCYISGNTVVIVLANATTVNNLFVFPTANNVIADLNYNQAILPSQIGVTQ